MTDEQTDSNAISLTKARLEGLSDGIFAFAMTLLVIGLALPDKTTLVQTNDYVIQVLLSLHSDFLHYVIAFLILGAFWLGHHTLMHPLRKIDRVFVWINLLTLLFVALLPFTTSFSGDFSEVPLGSIVFQLNLSAIGMGMYCQWKYASGSHRLVELELRPDYIQKVGIRNLLVPGVSVICILTAMSGSHWSSALYLLLPVFGYALEHVSVLSR